MSATTRDAFLGGRLTIEQPRSGYRAATDPVFLAAAIAAQSGQSALELGCGVGAAALCLMARVPGLAVAGLELQPEYAALARSNAKTNDLPLEIIDGDVTDPPRALIDRSFDHVFCNPPYFVADATSPPSDPGRNTAHRETDAALAAFLDTGLRRLKPKGVLTLIQRTERLAEILAGLGGRAGDIRVLPLAPRTGRDATRIIVRARKGARAPLSLSPPLIVHHGAAHLADGSDYSEAAEAVLRQGNALSF